MNEAQTINEYTTFLQQSQKHYESKGEGTNFRRMSQDGTTYFMRVSHHIHLDKVVDHQVVESLKLSMNDAVVTLASGGWERV